MHSTEGKRLEPPTLIYVTAWLRALGLSRSESVFFWVPGSKMMSTHMAYEYVPCSRMAPQWFCTGVVKTFVLEPYEQHTLNQMSWIKDTPILGPLCG